MTKRKIKKIGKILYWTLFVVLLLVSVVLILATFDVPGGFKLYTVQSGSMEPAISTGSIVVSRPSKTYTLGNIITFKNESDRNNPNPQFTTTHRIVDQRELDGEIAYITKGDANDGVDGTPVQKDLILGKVIFSTPLLGYLIGFTRTQKGLIFLIIIPATIIVYNELLNIQKEIKKLLEKRKVGKKGIKSKIGEGSDNKFTISSR